MHHKFKQFNELSFTPFGRYQTLLDDPLQLEFAKIACGAKSNTDFKSRISKSEEAPRVNYDLNSYEIFEDLVFGNKNFTSAKEQSELNGYNVLRTYGQEIYFDHHAFNQVKRPKTYYCFRNIKTGVKIHFNFESNSSLFNDDTYPYAIHFMLIEVEKEKQNKFFPVLKAVKDFRRYFLDEIGIHYAWGRVYPDNTFEIKNPKDNWREKKKKIKSYKTGETNDDLHKLTSLWLRCGFVYPEKEDQEFPIVFLLSEQFQNQLLQDPKKSSWIKSLLKFSK